MTRLTEPEMAWAHRMDSPKRWSVDEHLFHLGLQQCPGFEGRGCLTLLPIGSENLLCRFCQGKVRRRNGDAEGA